MVDFGCGSGVLSIVAVKLGFAPVIALDTEETAIEATLANAAVNGVEVDARRVDVLTDELPPAEIASRTSHGQQSRRSRRDCNHGCL